MSEKDQEKHSEWHDNELEAMFDSLITKSYVEDSIAITKDIKITLRVLSSEELMAAETIWFSDMTTMPRDVISKARILNILTYATTAINGKMAPKEGQGYSGKDIENWRRFLHTKYSKLSPTLIDRMYSFYQGLNERQAKLLLELVGEEGNGKLEGF